MRPSVLDPLFSDVVGLKGVGSAIRARLKKLFSKGDADALRLLDLLFHLPVNITDRKLLTSLDQAKDGQVATFIVEVELHEPPPAISGNKRTLKPYTIRCRHETGFVSMVFFHAAFDYLTKQFPVGQKRLVSGVFQKTQYGFQISHPDIVTTPDQLTKIERLEPVYPLTQGISQQMMIRMMDEVCARTPELAEWIDGDYLKQQGFSSWRQAIVALHHPAQYDDIKEDSIHRRRMAYDELLASQLALAIIRTRVRRKKVDAGEKLRQLIDSCLALLPFELTADQKFSLSEITSDLDSGHRMLRLLQGDVGSGKTVIALLSALHQVERGRQAAIMVPTEILGRQHLAFIAPIAARLGICVDILTGSLKSKEHREVRARIESGAIDIIIGTHALFQDSVEFTNLGLVVMDEQHRFGVEQRLKLTSKGRHPHILQMTATPIPRSLTMTAFGDMEVSQIKQKPPGRKPIDTRAIPISRADEIIEAIGRAVGAGGKVYWICPLIEEQDDDEIMRLDLAAAEARFTEFTARFGAMVGLVHGRMKSPEREAVMARFANGDCKILVATTVIEVGVNVPDATIMVIEHAERFGLSQLHQLRGRVGRSEKSSTCILLYADMAGKTAQDRLRVMRETEDGFDIAEQDLRIRGGGEVLGTKQSGMPDFHFADLVRHRDLIFTARDDVKLILHRDAKLESSRGQALRTLLYLYSYDENIRYLDSG